MQQLALGFDAVRTPAVESPDIQPATVENIAEKIVENIAEKFSESITSVSFAASTRRAAIFTVVPK